jgi:hypothetical protein
VQRRRAVLAARLERRRAAGPDQLRDLARIAHPGRDVQRRAAPALAQLALVRLRAHCARARVQRARLRRLGEG